MVKGYKSKHPLVKKHIPKDFRQLADSAIDHIGEIIDKLTVEDLIKVAVYANASYLVYITIHKSTALWDAAKGQILLREIPEDQARRMVLRWPYAPRPVSGQSVIEKAEENAKQIDFFVVQISMIIGYYLVYKPEVLVSLFGKVQGIGSIVLGFLGS